MAARDYARPEWFLAALCTAIACASIGYDTLLARVFDQMQPMRWFGDFALAAMGWLSFIARRGRCRACLTLLCALVAVPDHDRWCMPRAGYVITSTTAPLFLFLPLALWAAFEIRAALVPAVGGQSGLKCPRRRR
jgi:hypothetical protein